MTPTEKDLAKARTLLYCIHDGDPCEGDAEVIAQALSDEREEVLKKVKPLLNYLSHINTCIVNSWEAGEPTEGGGYRSKFAGQWYQSKPVDETPKCDCGLVKAFAEWEGKNGNKA